MKRLFICIGMIGALACSAEEPVVSQQNAPQEAAAPQSADETQPEMSEDEVAVRAASAVYVAAFNRADALAIAALWNEGGEYHAPSGERLVGREQLQADFVLFFQEKPGVQLEVADVSVEFLSPNVAIERGLARVVAPEQEPGERHFEAVYVKSSNGWKLDAIRELDPPVVAPSQYERLKDLEWMIGTWVDADESSTIETTSRWTTNQNFIVRSFKVYLNEQIDFEGTQVIGWDASTNAIRSWTFDSDGGFGVGQWSGGGNRWTVHSLNVTPDGGRATSANIYELIDENTIQFSSIGRQVDGELLPNIQPVVVVRSE